MKDKKVKLNETDLYKPIRNYFTKQGFNVYGEVQHCDMAVIKDNELILIELKLNLTVDLLIQATKRQRLTDLVYVAIPKPKYSLRSKKWRDILHLMRRLELGLIIVQFLKSSTKMDVVVSPAPFDGTKSRQLNKKKRVQLLKEIEGRNGDYNVGGSNKTKIMTAYKESCIHIATLLARHGPLSPKLLRQRGTGEKTLSILNKNYYGWYDKIQRGLYSISEKGKKELLEYPEQVQYFIEHDPE
ncbi:DUF2161 domain-containing phosphodiesterase [Neobacillus sp. D3-1R]|uniref:DUF2161 domain-containing phosphodiesterase n=1 Tax=Neobacillus sp. D3-1R TaxID=3445778 RepID=UPI003FA09F5A